MQFLWQLPRYWLLKGPSNNIQVSVETRPSATLCFPCLLHTDQLAPLAAAVAARWLQINVATLAKKAKKSPRPAQARLTLADTG